MNRIFVITGTTESYDPFVYVVKSDRRPSDDEVDTIIYRDWSEEYEDLGYTNWDIEETTFSDLPNNDEIGEFLENRLNY